MTLEEMLQKAKSKYDTLKAAFETVDYQYKNLKNFTSQPQLRIWYFNRRKLRSQLKEAEKQVQLLTP
jgi:predicted  nucleic acid-binding Zn-ribbon protein